MSSIYGSVKEEFVRQPFKNAELAFKEAMQLIAQEDWEKKCHAMNIIRRLSLYHEDLTVNNIHTIVLALVPEVKPFILTLFTNQNIYIYMFGSMLGFLLVEEVHMYM